MREGEAAAGGESAMTNGGGSTGTSAVARDQLDAISEGVGIHGERSRGWFTKVVASYLRRYQAKRTERQARVKAQTAEKSPTDAAHAAILKACIKSAVTGAAAGSVSTVATMVTAQTEGVGGFVAIPVAAVTIGGEMLYRSFVHLDLTCELAEIFGINFDPNDRDDLFRLYALVFNAHDHDEQDPGQELVGKVTEVEREQVTEQIGHKLLGESVARNVVPFFGIAASAVTNFVLTRRLGNTVRRYMRYERAMHDAFAQASVTCKEYLDLLIEGMWFIFTADGKLAPEETATLAHMLDKLDPIERAAVQRRFVEDELEWADRIEKLPEGVRDHFLHALEVAAAVDKEISLPERKILRRAAHHLNREFDLGRLERMIRDFEEFGVLSEEHQRVAKSS
jgi:uncharacterized tellurite resistance protein B-like protein